jgi:hypothetical protein
MRKETKHSSSTLHEKDFFILTNICETLSFNTKTRLGSMAFFLPLSLVFVLKLIPAFMCQNNNFFIMHVLKKDVLFVCA